MYKVYIFNKAKIKLNKIEGISKNALLRLIDKSSNKKWFNSHKKTCINSDLIILKQNKTAERIGGFIKDNVFYVCVVFSKHQVYENKINEYYQMDFPINNFYLYKKGEFTKTKMNKLINENKNLRKKIASLESKIANLNLLVDENTKIKKLEETIIFLKNSNDKLEKDIRKFKYGNKINKQKNK